MATLEDTTAAQRALKARRRLSLLALTGIAATGALTACSTQTTTDTATTESSSNAASSSALASTSSSSAAATSSSAYKDGTYTAQGSYSSPGGNESISVSITLASDTVTAVTVTPQATSGQAADFQKKFASGISSEVVGKKLSSLSVSRVSGSSLTSEGFNSAIDEIKSEARA